MCCNCIDKAAAKGPGATLCTNDVSVKRTSIVAQMFNQSIEMISILRKVACVFGEGVLCALDVFDLDLKWKAPSTLTTPT